MSGDLELGATGTVTDVDGDRVYAFGHPFYGLGPDAVPDDARLRARRAAEPASSMKIASTGDVIGTVQQDRATTIAGTLGAGPGDDSRSRSPHSRSAARARRSHGDGERPAVHAAPRLSVDPQHADLVRAPERRRPATPCAARRRSRITARSPSRTCSPATSRRPAPPRTSSAPINFLLRNSFEDVELEGAEPRDRRQRAAAQRDARARVDRRHARPKPGTHGRPQGAAAHLPRRGDHASRCRCRFRRTRAAACR